MWNNGWAYGDRLLPHRKALLIGTASSDAASYAKRRYDEAMRIQLVTGIMEYCGIPESELHLLYDVMAGEGVRREALATARRLGVEYYG